MGQQSGNTTTIQQQQPPAWLQPYIGTALQGAGALYQGAGPQYYPGQQVADLNPLQEESFGNIEGIANSGGYNPAIAGSESTLGMFQPGQMTNPALDAMFQQAAGATQNQLASEFAGSGRNIEASAPLRGEQLNNLATSIYGGAYDANQNRALSAASTLGNLGLGQFGMNLGAQSALTGAGNQVQQQAQNLIGANKSLYDYYQMLPYEQQQLFTQMLSGLPTGMTGSTQSPYFTNNLAQLLGMGAAGTSIAANLGLIGGGSTAATTGGGLAAADAAAAASSDRRLKTDIERIGTLPSGLPAYAFRYRGKSGIHIGVMADEAAEFFPEAVFRGADGYDRVDYSKVA